MATIWNHSTKLYTGAEFSDPGSGLNLGVSFCAFAAVTITHISFWKVSTDTATSRAVGIYNASGTLVASGTSSSEPVGTAGWINVALDTPLALTGAGLGTGYTAVVFYANLKYPATNTYFSSGYYSADSKVYAYDNSEAFDNVGLGNGCFVYDSVFGRPTESFNWSDYWIDVVYTASGGTPVTVNLTGRSATTAIGNESVIGKARVSPTGRSGTMALGNESVLLKLNVPVTGRALTTARGSVTTIGKARVSPTGVAGVSARGSVSVTTGGGVSVSVTGRAGATASGNESVVGKATVSPTGRAGASAIGNESVIAKATVSPTGRSAATARGTVSVIASSGTTVSVTGQSLTTARGSVILPNVQVFPTGRSATFSSGNVAAGPFTGVIVYLEGWGYGAWGDGGWGEGNFETSLKTSTGVVDIIGKPTIHVTGVSAATAVGSVSIIAKAKVYPTGTAGITATGIVDYSLDCLFPVTGRGMTTALGGGYLIEIPVTVDGVSAATSIGSVYVTGGATAYPVGVLGDIEFGYAYTNAWDRVPDGDTDWTPVAPPTNDWTPVPTGETAWTPVAKPANTWTPVTAGSTNWTPVTKG